jgi:glucuronate isomerase
VIDAEREDFRDSLDALSERTNLDAWDYSDYLKALRKSRLEMKALGATATDHGHSTAQTLELTRKEAEALFRKITRKNGRVLPEDAEVFRAHMLMEMAAMSLDDGLTMQIHPGSFRNHNQSLFEAYGRDLGADIPVRTEYVRELRALLNRFGGEPGFRLIVFTLDESTYSRELAPLAGHYPALKLGPAWWFHDSPEGMLRYRQQTTETAGFYNTAGFNDDTRAFLSIPARHDMARRMDCRFLAQWIGEHRLTLEEGRELALELTHGLVRRAYRL